jgi:hypothetical protein
MSNARRRDEAVKPEDAEHDEKKEPGENSSDSRRDSGEVVDVDELLEAYALREGEKAVLRRRRKPAFWRGGVMDWNILGDVRCVWDVILPGLFFVGFKSLFVLRLREQLSEECPAVTKRRLCDRGVQR